MDFRKKKEEKNWGIVFRIRNLIFSSYYDWLLKEMRKRGMVVSDADVDYYEAPNVGHIKVWKNLTKVTP